MARRVDLGKIIPEKGVDYYTEAEKNQIEDEITDRLVGLYKRYESTYTTISADEDIIPIEIEQYDENCILEVYIEGRILNQDEYEINGTNSITLTNALSEIGTVVQFVVYKFAQVDSQDYSILKGDKGDSGAIVFNTIAEMIADEDLQAGDSCQTLGYYSVNDGGAGLYKIVNDDTLVDDGGSIHELENGLKAELIINNNQVCYNQFGAHGDGRTDEWDYLNKTHIFANKYGYTVIGCSTSTYYVKDLKGWIVVRTNVDLCGAHFIIDDRVDATYRSRWLFGILGSDVVTLPESDLPSSLKAGQKYIESLANYKNIIITFNNTNKKLYREGVNSSDVASLSETVRVQNGYLLDDLAFDYDTVTGATYRDLTTDMENPIEFKNGTFTTYANTIDSYSYWQRTLYFRRSNIRISGINYYIEKEDDTETSAPYQGFISIDNSSNVTIENCKLQAHKMYQDEITTAWKGSYSLNFSHSCDIFCKNIQQVDGILDTTKWGIHTSNVCHNLHFENCVLSRIDCHRYLYNGNIKNCKIGHHAIKVGYGYGILDIEQTEVINSNNFLELRSDYGSSFDGSINIKNCKLIGTIQNKSDYYILMAMNDADFNYGYKCFCPNININGFHFNVKASSDLLVNCCILNTNLQKNVDFYKSYEENATNSAYPYIHKGHISLKNMTVETNNLAYNLLNPYRDLPQCYMENLGTAINESNEYYLLEKMPHKNCIINIDNCAFGNKLKLNRSYNSANSSFFLGNTAEHAGETFKDTYRCVCKLIVNNCNYLQLGNLGRIIEYHINNSDIYFIRSGTTNINACVYFIKNSTFHYKYPEGQTTLDNTNKLFHAIDIMNCEDCTFNINEAENKFNFEQLRVGEFPFTGWGINVADGIVDLKGEVINCAYNFTNTQRSDFTSNTFIRNCISDYGMTRDDLLNHKRNIYIRRLKGTDSEKPKQYVSKPIRGGHTYYATDTNKYYIWNASTETWVSVINT